jgi:hypothetical protein
VDGGHWDDWYKAGPTSGIVPDLKAAILVRRVAAHLTVLAVLATLSATGLALQWPPEIEQTAIAATESHPVVAANAPVAAKPIVAPVVGVARGVSTSPLRNAGPLAVASRPDVRWVQAFRPAELYLGPEPGAARERLADQWTTLELVEQNTGGRSTLRDPGRGAGALPHLVYADLGSFGPSGPPKPDFELAGDTVLDPATGRAIMERTNKAWPPPVSGEMAVVLDAESGAVLFGKNARVRNAPASLTKIVTAIVAIERAAVADRVKVNVDSRAMPESTVMGLVPGEELSLETLLYGLMLPSGNDAAVAIAQHVAGSESAFVQAMNDRVKSIGIQDTQFRNPHGLDADGHYSTAFDMANLTRFGFRDPTFAALSAAKSRQLEGYNLWNLNRLIGVYPGADGVKVGFTDNAGRCLVASATRDGRRVIVAVIRSADASTDSRILLDYAFNSFRWL